MLLVVMYHCKISIINDEIDMMFINIRVPMFFFLSGLFFKRYDSFKEFIVKKVNQLIVPYFFFSYIPFCLFAFFYNDRWADPLFYLFAPIKPYNTPLWFLRSLFLLYVFYYFIDRFTENKSKWLQMLIVCTIVAFAWITEVVMLKHQHLHPLLKEIFFLIVNVFISIKAILYFFLAQQVRKRNWLDFKINWTYTLLFSAVAIFVAYLFRQDRINAYSSNYVEHILFSYICSFSSFIAFGLVFAKLKDTWLLLYYGKNSLVVLGCHFLSVIILISNFHLPNYIVFIITFILMFPCIYFFKRFFPKFTAQEELFKSKS